MITAKMAALHTSVGATHPSLFHSKVSAGHCEAIVSSLWQKHALTVFFGVATCPPRACSKQADPLTFSVFTKGVPKPFLFCWVQHTIVPLAEGQTHSQDASGDKTEGKMPVILPLQPCLWAWLPLLSQPLVPLVSSQVQAVALRG